MKKPETCPVAARPQLPPLVAPGKVDLARVLAPRQRADPGKPAPCVGSGLLRDRLRGSPAPIRESDGPLTPPRDPGQTCEPPARQNRRCPRGSVQIGEKLEYRRRNHRPSTPPENRTGVESEALIIRQSKTTRLCERRSPQGGEETSATRSRCAPIEKQQTLALWAERSESARERRSLAQPLDCS